MNYILDERFCLRGWERVPFAVLEALTKQTAFVPKEQFVQLMRCDAMGHTTWTVRPWRGRVGTSCVPWSARGSFDLRALASS